MAAKPKKAEPEAQSIDSAYDEFRRRVLLIVGKEAPLEEVSAPAEGAYKSVTLYYTDPAANSDKIYKIDMIRSRGLYSVNFAYGRRGGTLTEGTKTVNPVVLTEAERLFKKLVDEKKSKGYTERIDGGLK